MMFQCQLLVCRSDCLGFRILADPKDVVEIRLERGFAWDFWRAAIRHGLDDLRGRLSKKKKEKDTEITVASIYLRVATKKLNKN